jgi:hypothetical protein
VEACARGTGGTHGAPGGGGSKEARCALEVGTRRQGAHESEIFMII